MANYGERRQIFGVKGKITEEVTRSCWTVSLGFNNI